MKYVVHSASLLLQDLLSSLVFAIVFSTTRNAVFAALAAIAISLAQIALGRVRKQPVSVMLWLSLGLVIVLGTATVLLRDPRFVMFKLTIVLTAVGMVMLKPGWMARYLPEIALAHGKDLAYGFGYAWAALMFITAGANAIVAASGDVARWGRFVAVFPLASKLALFAIQYATMRLVIGQRRARAGLPEP